MPRIRSSSSAAMNSARPQVTSGPSRLGKRPVLARVQLLDMEGAVRHVRHVAAVRGEARVDRRRGRRASQAALAARGEVEPGRRPRARRPARTRRVSGRRSRCTRPRHRLTRGPAPVWRAPPPAAAPRRAVSVPASVVQRPWVDDAALDPGRDIQLPQAGHGVGAGPAAQEHDATTVGRDGDVAGHAQRESAGPGAEPGVALGHPGTIAAAWRGSTGSCLAPGTPEWTRVTPSRAHDARRRVLAGRQGGSRSV